MKKINASWFKENLYVFDLIKALLSTKNITAVIYLILNILLLCWVAILVGEGETGGIPVVLIIYLISVCFALSPFGEMILRFNQGCKKIKDTELLNRLEPLFMEVKETCQRKHPELAIHPRTWLYINESDDINACAIGHRTVCVTRGLLQLSDEEIKAVLGHEFGHLAMHDSDLLLLITVGNFMVTAVVSIFKFFITLFQLVFSLVFAFINDNVASIIGSITTAFASLLTLVFVDFAMAIWTKFGVWMVMKASRNAEYDADSFSCDLGYTDSLLNFFHKLIEWEGSSASKSSWKEKAELFTVLSDSHPKTQKRIDRILKRTAGTAAK